MFARFPSHVRPLAVLFPLLLLASPVLAFQAGSLSGEAKIDAFEGGLTGPLDDGDEFGAAVAALGDRDGDGLPDAAVGAPGDDASGTDAGAVYLLGLDAAGSVASETRLLPGSGFPGTLQGGGFGTSLASLGDLDGDGIDDLAVGTPRDFDNSPDAGAIWIVFLAADGSAKAAHRISDASPAFSSGFPLGAGFGTSVAALGDLDGDGNVDLIAGTPDRGLPTARQGSAWVLFLRANGTVRSVQELNLASPGFPGQTSGDTQFGMAVAELGDLNGDGTPDVAIGSPEELGATTESGDVWITFLNADGTVQGVQQLSNLVGGIGLVQPGSQFGMSLGAAGDIDGDGRQELLAGSNFNTMPFGRIGLVWVLFLDTTGSVSGIQLIGTGFGGFVGPIDTSSRFAEGLVGLGDLDGDGSSDVFSGAPGEPDGGAGFLLYLSTGDPTSGFTADVVFGCSPLDVQFTDLSTGTGLSSWLWDFGDGTTSSERSPAHTYSLIGNYDVSLTVTGAAGTSTRSVLSYVRTTLNSPQIDFDGTPTLGTAPLVVDFTDRTAGSVEGWVWSFGDGASSTEQNPTHTYDQAGSYTVTLTASCVSGFPSTTTRSGFVVVTDATASATPDNGQGVNPNIFSSLSPPLLGTDWVSQVDGTSLGASGLSFLVGYTEPLVPGVLLGPGELLIDPGSGFVVLDFELLIGGIGTHTVSVPNDPLLAGFEYAAQVLLNGVPPGGQLTNRIDLVLGT